MFNKTNITNEYKNVDNPTTQSATLKVALFVWVIY